MKDHVKLDDNTKQQDSGHRNQGNNGAEANRRLREGGFKRERRYRDKNYKTRERESRGKQFGDRIFVDAGKFVVVLKSVARARVCDKIPKRISDILCGPSSSCQNLVPYLFSYHEAGYFVRI